jgi:cytochrome c biogenesis protein CcmG/thiol:disulfide interchange protein DsbE
MPERTWKAAFGEVSRAARRHKVRSGLVAVVVAGSLAALALAGGSANSAGSGSKPQAAAFSLPVLGPSGVGTGRVSLAAYAGKPLIVNFFASWCSPCKKETPLLARFYRSEHGRVAVVGLDENDTMTSALKFTSADGVTYPVGWDPSIAAASAYGVNGLPQTFFLDDKHRVVDRIFGAVTQADLDKGLALATAGTS